ncbi:4Fe-4S dicluster domain-containing protein [bacterium]|nr:4Fe-4S dicluster domain-containing protein [bacterium]MCK4436780.1 4Fe-4S dicluster domain-containing protein [bacterium]
MRKLLKENAIYAPGQTGENLYWQKLNSNTPKGTSTQKGTSTPIPLRAQAGTGGLENIVYDQIRAAGSIKPFLFHPKETVASYPTAKTNKETPEKTILIGPKACDLKALEVLDNIFQKGDFKDPFYIANRENTTVISSDCSSPADSCFCSLVDLSPYPKTGFDLNLSRIADGFVVEVGSSRGQELIRESEASFREASSHMVKERDDVRGEVLAQVKKQNEEYDAGKSYQEILKKNFEVDAWRTEAEKCVECAACVQVCPTCYCFLLYDQASGAEQTAGYEKVRVWDACQYPKFSQVAGGANPRKRRAERLRHRYAHKFDYFLENFDIVACTGCGRCIQACPGKIDMREVLSKIGK